MNSTQKNFDLAKKRQERGLTQQELAELSGLTSRTIQRIEKGDVVPYGDTIRKLAKGLDLSVDELKSVAGEMNENAQTHILAFYHFAPLLGIVIPFTNVLIPLFLWISYRDKHTLYDFHGRISLNFQLTITLLALIPIVLLVLYFPVGFPLLMGVGLYTVACCIINGIRALKNRLPKYYLFLHFL
ncbi:DUF4870 domain-containing protein [Leadbetterella sp. DM7]|uniref:DUF4870 domain-containing protein n=1 Tax=Leadbetterella sp. DM7 TaxID=3235085 RepID=UPI00349E59CF